MKIPEIEEIKKEFFIINKLHEIATFECYGDGILTYHLKHENTLHEICIIADCELFRDMKIVDILSTFRIKYLSHCVYLFNEGVGHDRISEKRYICPENRT